MTGRRAVGVQHGGVGQPKLLLLPVLADSATGTLHTHSISPLLSTRSADGPPQHFPAPARVQPEPHLSLLQGEASRDDASFRSPAPGRTDVNNIRCGPRCWHTVGAIIFENRFEGIAQPIGCINLKNLCAYLEEEPERSS